MFHRFHQTLTVVLAALLFAGMAHAAGDAATAKRQPLRKIALVAVPEPPILSVENRGSAWGLLAFPGAMAQKHQEMNRCNDLTRAVGSRSLKFGQEMVAALSDALDKTGFQVTLVTKVPYLPDDPAAVDYAAIETDADAILSAYYMGAGIYSAQFSTSYRPRLNLYAELVGVSDQSSLYSQSVYYGADARKSAEDQIPSDPKYAYGSFAEVMEKPDELVESYRIGIRDIAALIAKQIRDAGL